MSLRNTNVVASLHRGRPGGGGGGGGGGGNRIQCSATEQFMGTPSDTPAAAPLRGNVGCVDIAVLSMRDLGAMPIANDQDGANIYGPMEAGFTSRVPGMSCLGDNTISGGIDTNLAEHMVEYLCPGEDIQVLDACGGHAVPYHYHERMSRFLHSWCQFVVVVRDVKGMVQ